ncbi:hypothetical protein MLD38_027680 [Melastoma candidum]|uniref:Uncharacterized protein n=1 Tax=Melastoma candidum TaxID=119954 RepID=A0ACB9P5E7_9MYRT|nr:hypothetical protein MLD38_027680 [Melastoma candidum]
MGVTSVSFNPVDENFFISGSIDGKVRIWYVWRKGGFIVSAVCIRTDGKGAIIGTMTGNCHFYRIEVDHLKLELHGKKKSPGKIITGFQFPPNDPGKAVGRLFCQFHH